MFMDEGRFGRVDFPRRCWTPKKLRHSCPSQISYAFASLYPFDGRLESLIYPSADSNVMAFFLKQISDEFKDEFVAIFVDKAAWNTTAKLIIPENVHIEFLPPYKPATESCGSPLERT